MAKTNNFQKHVDLDNAREDDQVEIMQQIIQDDNCPFCLENLKKYHKQEILKEGEFWILTPNQWPYPHTAIHFLAIYKEHAEHLSELDPNAGKELIELMQWAEKQYQIPGGGLAFRFGDTDFSAGSVQHLHVQLIQPDIASEEYEPVRVKLGKSKDKLNRA